VSSGPDDANAHLIEAYHALLAEGGLDLAFADRAPDGWPDPYKTGSFDPSAARGVIRMLQQARRYDSYESVGTEPEADYLYRLATVGSVDGPYQGEGLDALQHIVERHMAGLRGALEARGQRLPMAVYAGVYPTGEFNARAHLVPPWGALLLLNSGLMDLMFTVLKTNLASSFSGPDDPPLLNEAQVTKVLAEAFNAYLYSESSIRSMGLPPVPPEREVNLDYVLRRAEQFVLAHEIGHVALGHLNAEGAGKPAIRSREQELAADVFAVDLLASLLSAPPGPARDNEATFLAGGILNFFEIAVVIVAFETSLGIDRRDASSHPDLAVRGEALVKRIRDVLPGADPLRRVGVFINWLGHYLPGIEETITKVNTLMKRTPYIKSW
jgi:hypothetical protein